MTTPTWQIHLRIIPQPSTTNPTVTPKLQIQTPTGLRNPETHELLELNILTVRLATLAARCAVMNVDAYAQEMEFVMRIRPRDGGFFEAELYAGGVEGPLVIGKVGYSAREAVEALIPPMDADGGVTDSLVTPRVRFEEGG